MMVPINGSELLHLSHNHPDFTQLTLEGAIMITEEDFDAASEASPEMAFVRLERKFRAVYEKKIEESDNGNT